MTDGEIIGRVLVAAGEDLITQSRKRHYRKRQSLGPDWRTWPMWAQIYLLQTLRSLDKK